MCIPCIIFIIAVSVMIGLDSSKYKYSILVWRLATPVSIVEYLITLTRKYTFQERAFSVLLLVHCLINMPFLAQSTTCFWCGQRVYWRGLISDKCPHCGDIYYHMNK